MKGMIFTEFLEMVETQFSPEVVEEILELSELPSGGSYTSLGTYAHAEILSLVSNLSRVTKVDPEVLQTAFGEYLFKRLADSHPQFIKDIRSSFDLLERVEDYIHVEVRKLYPESSPPEIQCTSIDEYQMRLHYKSHRPFSALALGLIQGVGRYFDERLSIRVEPLSDAGTETMFHLTRS
ncbi:heme NO-binding domain-containing protein [uncultured Endozoicomonas sp.]|uniref:heme NO-binding domain-containing protein n=1 Tax=uncultured Endozoicomonas sp. TaxID=432652 RepID=UPI0026234F7C|nr:heme NO-binding domain-containing protein [uncultured Endozoicomonas sp.]